MVTSALGIEAPEGSVTVPRTLAVTACALRKAGNTQAPRKMSEAASLAMPVDTILRGLWQEERDWAIGPKPSRDHRERPSAKLSCIEMPLA